MTAATLGKLSVVLDLDSGTFNGQVTRAGKTIRKFDSDLNRIPRATDGAQRSLGGLGASFAGTAKRLLGLYAGLVSARLAVAGFGGSVISASADLEKMTALLAGMSDAATDAGKLADAEKQLSKITELAKSTPFSIDAITSAWVKFKSAGLDPANGSLQSLLDAVARFGGSSSQLERASVAIQQMAGKGVISMEELRQQLGEAVPTAATDMAKALGMSVAQMSKAISSGSVQSKEALARLFAQFEQTYGGSAQKLMDTFGGRVAVLRTNWTELLREVGKSSGLFEIAKQSVHQLSASLNTPAVRNFAVGVAKGMATVVTAVARAGEAFVAHSRAVLVAGAALGSFLVTSRILIPAIRGLATATLALTGASGFGALAASMRTLGGASVLATAAIGRLRIALAALVTAGGVFTVAASALAALGTAWYLHKKRIDEATQALRQHGIAYDDFVTKEQEKRLAELKAQLERLQGGLSDPNLGGQEGMDNPGMVAAARKSMLVEIERTGKAIAALEDDLAKNRAAQAKQNAETQTGQELAEIQRRSAEIEALLSKPFTATAQSGNSFVEQWDSYFEELKDKTAQLKQAMKETALDDRESYFFTNLTSGLLDDIQQLNLGLISSAQQRATREIEIERSKVEAILQLNGANAEQVAAVQALLAEKIGLMQESLVRNQPINRMVAEWTDASQRMQEATASWIDGASIGLADFVTTGKFKFKDFADSVVKDLVRIATQKMIAGIVGSLFGGWGAVAGAAAGAVLAANGGVVDSRGLRAYANGGIANRPQVAVFGEGDTPEAYVPLPDGRTIPVTLNGQASSKSADPMHINVEVVVQNNTGSAVSSATAQSRFDGSKYILDVVLHGAARAGSFRDGLKSALR